MDLFGTIDQSSGSRPAVLGITGTGREGTSTAKWVRSISHPLERVNTGGSAASLRAAAGRIAGPDANLLVAFSCPWPPPATFATLLEMERPRSGG